MMMMEEQVYTSRRQLVVHVSLYTHRNDLDKLNLFLDFEKIIGTFESRCRI